MFRNGDGAVDPAELGELLLALGVLPTEQKFQSALSDICDHEREGEITFAEFRQWWNNESIEYVLKRSSAIRDPRNGDAMLRCVAAGAVRGSSTIGRSASLNVLACGTSRRGGTLRWKDSALAKWERDLEPAWHVTIGGIDAVPEKYRRFHPVEPDGEPRALTNGDAEAGVDGEIAASIAEFDVSSHEEITARVVCYRGKETQFEEKGLTPNQAYFFKLRYVGSRSSSFLSPPLMVMTAPLPCRQPAFVRLQGSTAKLKWYPPDFGAFSFEVQLQLAPLPRSGKKTKDSHTHSKSSEHEDPVSEVGSSWVNVYNGQETTWTATSATLTPETKYNVRVVAINAQGTMGEPSPVLFFETPSRETNIEPITKKNADYLFSIECIGDICVGDVILFHERLFRYENGFIDNSEKAAITIAAAASGATGLSQVPTKSNKPNAPKSPEKGKVSRNGKLFTPSVNIESRDDVLSTLRLDLGVTSSFRKLSLSAAGQATDPRAPAALETANNSSFSVIPGMGQFVGQRTIAAHVMWDNYRSIKEDSAEGSAPLTKGLLKGNRKLWLEVIWCRSSNSSLKSLELQPGTVINRFQTHLEQFEVFRLPWLHENKRRPLEEELSLLANCYGKFPSYHHYQCDSEY